MSDIDNPAWPERLRASAILAGRPVGAMEHPSLYRRFGKRMADVVLSVMLALVAAPVVLLIAILVSLDGASPIYWQRRVGRNGRDFNCYKFRSMVPNADARLADILGKNPAAAREWAATHKLEKDPRITRIGRILRLTSLDELPQLWNVLRGDMSLVGPRPVTSAELDNYGATLPLVLSTRPGMTGLWQVAGRGFGVSYAERVKMDVTYVRTLSLRRDLGIAMRTVGVVLRGTGT